MRKSTASKIPKASRSLSKKFFVYELCLLRLKKPARPINVGNVCKPKLCIHPMKLVRQLTRVSESEQFFLLHKSKGEDNFARLLFESFPMRLKPTIGNKNRSKFPLPCSARSFVHFAHSSPSDLMRNDPLNVAVKLIIQVVLHLSSECSFPTRRFSFRRSNLLIAEAEKAKSFVSIVNEERGRLKQRTFSMSLWFLAYFIGATMESEVMQEICFFENFLTFGSTRYA
jgi:hypothetical protein